MRPGDEFAGSFLRGGLLIFPGGFSTLDFFHELYDDFVADGVEIVAGFAAEEGVLGPDEAVEGGEGMADDVEEFNGLGVIGDLVGILDDTADVDAKEGDLVFEAAEAVVVEVGDVGGAEA